MGNSARESRIGLMGGGSKLLSVLMALVLAIGLMPIAPAQQAYAAESHTVHVVFDSTGGNVTLNNWMDETTIEIANGDATVEQGTYVAVAALPKDGYSVGDIIVRSNINDEDEPNQYKSSQQYFEMPGNDVTLKVTFESAASAPTITKATTTNGSFVVHAYNDSTNPKDISSASKGDFIGVTPTPAEGYEVDTVSYTYNDGSKDVTQSATKNSMEGAPYYFSMPDHDVTVTVTFKASANGNTLTLDAVINPEDTSLFPATKAIGEGIDLRPQITATKSDSTVTSSDAAAVRLQWQRKAPGEDKFTNIQDATATGVYNDTMNNGCKATHDSYNYRSAETTAGTYEYQCVVTWTLEGYEAATATAGPYTVEFKAASSTVDKSDLKAALVAARAAVEGVVSETDAAKVESGKKFALPTDMDTFTAAINDAKNVLDTEEAAQAAVTDATTKLTAATQKFTGSLKTGTKTASETYKVTTQVVKDTNDDTVVPGTVTVVGENGSPVMVNPSATITVKPEAAVGFTFEKIEWKADSDSKWNALTGDTYTFTMPHKDVTVKATFKDDRIDITGKDLKFFDDSYPYTGSVIKVEPTGIRGGASFGEGDYKVIYKASQDATEELESIKDEGSYWVTVVGQNKFKGSVSKTVEIVKGFDVYYKNPGDKKETKAKHFSEAEFAALAVTNKDPVSAIYGSKVASTQNYVELESLLEAAEIADKWTSGATVSYNAGQFTYGHDELFDTKFFPETTSTAKSTEGAVAAPFVIALTQASSDIKTTAGDAEKANVAAAKADGCPRVIVGLKEAFYTGAEKDESGYKSAGKRLWNNVTSITITTAGEKAKSTLAITAKSPSVTYSDSAQTIKAADAFTVENAKRTVTYSLDSTTAGITIDASTGDITLPAKLAAGPYTVKVKVADQGDDTTAAGTATADLKIEVAAAPATGGTDDTKKTDDTKTADDTKKTDDTTTTAKTSIAKAKVTLKKASAAYTGKTQKGAVKSVVLNKKTLKAGTDYTVTAKSGKKVGSYKVTVTGKGNYTGTATATFKITAASQAISAKNFSVTYKGSKLIKSKKLAKNQTIDVKAKAKASAKTTIKYAKANKIGGKYIAVNAKTGKITVKKGLKAGTYKVKVKMTAAKSTNYKAAKAKTITVTVKVAKK